MSRREFHGSCCVHAVPKPHRRLTPAAQAQDLARDLDLPGSIQPVTREGSVRLVMTSPYQYQSFFPRIVLAAHGTVCVADPRRDMREESGLIWWTRNFLSGLQTVNQAVRGRLCTEI
jgi:hypothetical protein